MRLTLLKIQTNCSHRLLLNAIPFRFHVLFHHGKGFKNCESFLCDYFFKESHAELEFQLSQIMSGKNRVQNFLIIQDHLVYGLQSNVVEEEPDEL